MSSNAGQMQSQGNLHPISEATQPSFELYLDELTHGVTGMIIMMICRSWDVHTITGRYASTYFVMFDAKGNAIHSFTKANVAHNFLKLKEGSVYYIKNFVIHANKEEYRIFRYHAYMIELDGAASVRKTYVMSGGFVRYPLQLAELDFARYVTNILDDPQIPVLKASRAENREDEVSLSQAVVHVDYSQAKEETLENLLIWAQNRKNDVRVKIDGIRTRKGWNFLFCSGEKCKKGVVRKEGSFWCQACDKAVEYPVLRFRLELDVSDKTASTVVVMFDEPATKLVKCSADLLAAADEDVGLAYADDVGLLRPLANIIGTTQTLEIKSHTYYEHGTFESFMCWRIASEEVVEEDARSSMVDLEDSNDEVTCGMDDGHADGKDSFVSDKRKKNRFCTLSNLSSPKADALLKLQKTKLKATIDNDSVNMDTPIASRSNILHKSFNIYSRTIITRDGKVQSYYGLKLTNIDTQASGNFVILCLLSERTFVRQYNALTVPEVAALITNDFGDGLPSMDIVVGIKDGGPIRISELHPLYMALQYPLLFPYGEDGYHEKIPYHTNRGTRKTKRGFVSMKEYYAYVYCR
ncbi:ATP-dependent DNA helicase PIF1-like protein [Tanacetum coccineum]